MDDVTLTQIKRGMVRKWEDELGSYLARSVLNVSILALWAPTYSESGKTKLNSNSKQSHAIPGINLRQAGIALSHLLLHGSMAKCGPPN
jgi:hypothetical protein